MQNPLKRAKDRATCAVMTPVRKIEDILTGLVIMVAVLSILTLAVLMREA